MRILCNEQGDQEWTESDQVLGPCQGATAGKPKSGPQADLAQVVWMPRNTPQALLDELTLI